MGHNVLGLLNLCRCRGRCTGKKRGSVCECRLYLDRNDWQPRTCSGSWQTKDRSATKEMGFC